MFILGRKHAVRSWHSLKAAVHLGHLQPVVLQPVVTRRQWSSSPAASRNQADTIFRSSSNMPVSSNTTGTTTSCDPPDREQGVISKVFSTVRHFNVGISRLKADFLTSLHIREAEATRIHLARKIRKVRESRSKRGGISVDSGECTLFSERRRKWLAKHTPTSPLINRRSKLHLTQLTKDLRTTLPTVLGFLLPGIGYTFLLLGVMFPRFLLSRQFHTNAQKREWGMDEYRIRREWYEKLKGDFWGSFMERVPQLVLSHHDIVENRTSSDTLSFVDMDAAGPVFDDQSILQLYDLCGRLASSETTHRHQSTTSFSNLPISHLHSISLACNLSSVIPLSSPMASGVLQYCVSRKFLESKLTTMAEEVVMDDLALLEECQMEACCSDLTDDEVLDACSIRGLPVGRFARDMAGVESSEIQCMRALLTNHLKMLQGVMMCREKSPSLAGNQLKAERCLVRDDALKFLVLHLPSLRCSVEQSTRKPVM